LCRFYNEFSRQCSIILALDICSSDRVTYVVFKNLKDGDSLPDYELSDEAIQFREKFRPYQIVMPRLDEEYATELERLNLTIADVLDPKERSVGPLLGKLMVKSRLRRYQQNIYEQINPLSMP